jgi:GNAT superfamily N-acetyltransferase
MSPPRHIRAATMDDCADIARLSGELGYPSSIEQIGANLGKLLGSVDCFVAVAAEAGARVSGWMVVERRLALESGEQAEITGLVVANSARRTGVGRALVSAAEQWAAERGLTNVRVRSNIARGESHPFYERLGYMRSKTQHCYAKHLSEP